MLINQPNQRNVLAISSIKIQPTFCHRLRSRRVQAPYQVWAYISKEDQWTFAQDLTTFRADIVHIFDGNYLKILRLKRLGNLPIWMKPHLISTLVPHKDL